jgi:hypothetical protein
MVDHLLAAAPADLAHHGGYPRAAHRPCEWDSAFAQQSEDLAEVLEFLDGDRVKGVELVEKLGVGADAIGYQYTQRVNISDARITGWEARADLPLANFTSSGPLSALGEWPRHFTLLANFTHLDLSGSRITSADWRRYIPRGRNLGMRFSFTKLSGNLLLNWRGRMLRDTATHARSWHHWCSHFAPHSPQHAAEEQINQCKKHQLQGV